MMRYLLWRFGEDEAGCECEECINCSPTPESLEEERTMRRDLFQEVTWITGE